MYQSGDYLVKETVEINHLSLTSDRFLFKFFLFRILKT